MFQSRRGCCGGPIFTGFWKSHLKDFDKHICLMLIAFWFSVWSVVCYLPCALRGQSDMPCLDLTFPYVTCLMFSIVKALASSAQCKRLRLRRVEVSMCASKPGAGFQRSGEGVDKHTKMVPHIWLNPSQPQPYALNWWSQSFNFPKRRCWNKDVLSNILCQWIGALHDTPACHSYNKTHDQEWSEDNVIHIC